MKITLIMTSIVANPIVDRFQEGGPIIMSLILICLLLSIFLLITGFLNLKKNNSKTKKMIELVVDTSLLGLVIGFFGSILGVISAFDSVEAMGEADPAVFSSGLKVSLLTATFGLFTFVIARAGILLLRWIQND